MLITLILIICLLYVCYWHMKRHYDLIYSALLSVQEKRKMLNQQLNDRHHLLKEILSLANKNQHESIDSIEKLKILREQLKEAHRLKDTILMAQIEAYINSHSEVIMVFMSQHPDIYANVFKSYQMVDVKVFEAIADYHEEVERYEELCEHFIESVLVALFEKTLYHKFPFFEVDDE